jgi:HEAT repeat protein
MGDQRSPDPASLREALRRGSASERSAAIESAHPAPGLEAVLIEALDDPEQNVRLTAVRALAALARARGSRALMRSAANDPASAVRAEAVAALGRILADRIGPQEPPPLVGRPA